MKSPCGFEKVGDGTWLTGMTRYEGYPLALRVRPSVDSAANRAAFPYLGVITHQLAHVRDNGLPETEYNRSLEDFDVALQSAMKGEEAGLVVLIETFAGKRTYYAYVSDEKSFRARVSALARVFEHHQLTIECRRNAEWRFYERYRNDFPW
jgi:hypothetical protein